MDEYTKKLQYKQCEQFNLELAKALPSDSLFCAFVLIKLRKMVTADPKRYNPYLSDILSYTIRDLLDITDYNR